MDMVLPALTAPLAAPAPWRLCGDGVILFYRFNRHLSGIWQHHYPVKLDKPALTFGAVMLVDYRESPVGPYRELLLIPGIFRFGMGFYPSITHIYVSSEDSVVNGYRNWGIPKKRCDFERRGDRFILTDGGTTIADLQFKTLGPRFPVTTITIPGMWRTLCHMKGGQRLKTTVSGNGSAQLARMTSAYVDHGGFPDFTRGTLLTAWKIDNFELFFPPARMSAP
ncbi:hypothetical protein [Acanthopleuribacter pedis]|uniref:Acetoacetate decarboxylase n=1 Tax=Acanthopleuribacter pedis TaxID=442870 RepID=A0A8J7Q4A6_9BACT|nr:hypothetical protein [Acanthopleuribacter pedis]MBO1317461.1 hypothetical protein [Acanthopleuribacter pedis]